MIISFRIRKIISRARNAEFHRVMQMAGIFCDIFLKNNFSLKFSWYSWFFYHILYKIFEVSQYLYDKSSKWHEHIKCIIKFMFGKMFWIESLLSCATTWIWTGRLSVVSPTFAMSYSLAFKVINKLSNNKLSDSINNKISFPLVFEASIWNDAIRPLKTEKAVKR